ncbi:MAG TPA: hypothetical protein V6D50_18895 [Chroococcales cyanobacterium]
MSKDYQIQSLVRRNCPLGLAPVILRRDRAKVGSPEKRKVFFAAMSTSTGFTQA